MDAAYTWGTVTAFAGIGSRTWGAIAFAGLIHGPEVQS